MLFIKCLSLYYYNICTYNKALKYTLSLYFFTMVSLNQTSGGGSYRGGRSGGGGVYNKGNGGGLVRAVGQKGLTQISKYY